MANIKKTPIKTTEAEPVEVEETISLEEFEELRAELKKLRDKMNEAPTHIPETPEVDKFAERNFEQIALNTKADLEKAEKVNIIFPSDPTNPYDDIQYFNLNGMIYQFPKGEEVQVPRPLYEIWKDSYNRTKKGEARVKSKDFNKDEPNAILNR